MTRSIRIGDIGSYCEQQVEQLLRATVLETDRRLKERSPVDSGRLRVSWQIGENSASGTPAAPGNYRGMASPPVAINYQAGQERLGNVYSIHNNLPYAEPVLTGRNLPPSWNGTWRSKGNQIQQNYIPHVIAKDMQDFIKKNAERISRES